MSSDKTVSILGSTGSIGKSTVDLLAANPERFRVKTLTANKNAALLVEQAQLLKAEIVAIGDETLFTQVRDALPDTVVLAGRKGILQAAAESCDLTVAAIMGMAGIEPILAAIPKIKTLAIANKEPLVAAGAFVIDLARQHNVQILPLDSEHNAIFQVFDERNRASIRKLILTASGGPFLNLGMGQLEAVTVDQALKHPNWSMGAKISIDSATMMNKALEVIEAHYLFDMIPDKIDVLIHPQSVIHSMVEYDDGSVLAQLGAPDMRTPIAYALAWPERMPTTGRRLDFADFARLDFQKPNLNDIPALQMAYECLNEGQTAQIIFNAANEIAVEAFLTRQVKFTDILKIVGKALDNIQTEKLLSLSDILDFDIAVRSKTKSYIVQK